MATQQVIESVEKAEDLTPTEYQEIIRELKAKCLATNQELVNIKARALSVYEENQKIQGLSDPIHKQLKDELEVAELMVRSGAFPKQIKNAPQAWVMIKAGEEIGLSPMQSVKGLNIINGVVSVWGSTMISILTKRKYVIDYLKETNNQVLVTVSKGEEHYEYFVKDDDPALKNSKAMAINKKNKMRYHGVRQILKFRLPHYLGSVAPEEQDDFDVAEKNLHTYEEPLRIKAGEEEEILNNIENQETTENAALYYSTLDEVYKTEKVRAAFIAKKKELRLSSSENPQ